MRLLATAIVSGSLGLIGALPAAADQSNSYDSPIQLAAGSGATAARDGTRTLRRRRATSETGSGSCASSARRRRPRGKKKAMRAENELNAAWATTRWRHRSCRPRARKAGIAQRPLSRRHPKDWRTLGTSVDPRTNRRAPRSNPPSNHRAQPGHPAGIRSERRRAPSHHPRHHSH